MAGVLLVGCEEAGATAQRAPVLGEVGQVGGGEGVGALSWTRTLVLGDSEAPRAVVASNGDVLLAATYREPIDLGEGPLPFDRGAAGPHLLVARLSPEGALRWARGLTPDKGSSGGGPEGTRVGGLAVDAAGRVWLGGTSTGFTWKEARLPAGPFLARLSGEGSLDLWRSFPGDGPLAVHGVATDADGGAVVVGDFSGRRDFGGGVLAGSKEGRGAFVARFGADGAPRWSRAWTADKAGEVSARAVALDVFGAVHVVGAYAGAVSFGGPSFLTVRPHTPFVLKLAEDGTHLWSHDARGTDGAALAVAVGANRVFVGGGFSGRLYFKGTWHQADSRDGFLLAYDGAGGQRWARTFPTSAPVLATDEAGQVTVAGIHDGSLSLGPLPLPAGVYVARLLPEDGATVWVRGFAGAGALPGTRAVTVDASGHTLVAGGLGRPASPDARPPHAQDGFLLRLDP